MKKVEDTAKKADKKKTGRLTVDDYYDVIKKKNSIEVTKTEIRGGKIQSRDLLLHKIDWGSLTLFQMRFHWST